ncbi:MAG: hypothetical protein ACK4V5_00420 [Cyanobium sp.]|jgi:hypothetical protein
MQEQGSLHDQLCDAILIGLGSSSQEAEWNRLKNKLSGDSCPCDDETTSGQDIISDLRPGSIKDQAWQMISLCSDYDNGLLLLNRAFTCFRSRQYRNNASEILCSIAVGLSNQTFLHSETGDPRSAVGKFSKAVSEKRERENVWLRDRLALLAETYASIDSSKFESCLNATIRSCFPSQPLSQVYPPVFCDQQIRSWHQLLQQVEHHNQYFDHQFLDELQKNLSGDRVEPLADDGVGSLVIMLLSPRNKPGKDIYSYRAYYCKAGSSSPEDWIKVFDPAAGSEVRLSSWREDLQRYLPVAIREMRRYARSQSRSLQVRELIEFFLPTELIDADMGSLTILAADDLARPLRQMYRTVVRSAYRYRLFVEDELETIAPNHLPGRWLRAAKALDAQSSACYWWHDTSLQPGDDGSSYEDTDDWFGELEAGYEYFGMKRLHSLAAGDLYERWKEQLILAAPAVSLWWPPAAASKLEHREAIFADRCSDSGVAPFGSSRCCGDSPRDPFYHPDAADSLKLFFALASAVFRGRRTTGPKGQAFREMVILVDCVDRWPPPLDVSPARQPDSGQSGPVIVDADEIHRSE